MPTETTVGDGHGSVVYSLTTLVVYERAAGADDALSCLCLCEELDAGAAEALEIAEVEELGT